MSDSDRMVEVFMIGGLDIQQLDAKTPVLPDMHDALEILGDSDLGLETEYYSIYKASIDFTEHLTTESFEGVAILVLAKTITEFERVF